MVISRIINTLKPYFFLLLEREKLKIKMKILQVKFYF